MGQFGIDFFPSKIDTYYIKGYIVNIDIDYKNSFKKFDYQMNIILAIHRTKSLDCIWMGKCFEGIQMI
jgi:hypothetical protein